MQSFIHPTAFLSSNCEIAENVKIGAFACIHEKVSIGYGTTIGEHCVLGGGPLEGEGSLFIGAYSKIRSHSAIYAGSRFESQLETGHHVVIREKTFAGANLRIGNFSDIEGECTIGDYCRLHGYVHLGKNTKVGDFVWLFSLTTATNDPLPPSRLVAGCILGDGSVVCVGAILMPGTTLGCGAFVTAGSIAQGDVPDGAVVSGADGCVVSHVSTLMHMQSGLRHPWMRHFAEAYPAECQDRLKKLLDKILYNRFSLRLTGENIL
jgi:acyl-[acyl carrier protein]--UDP-N-acetylglucosamine O-acyltransferase